MKKSSAIESAPGADAKEKRSKRARPNVPAHVRNLLRLKQQQSGGSFPAEIPLDARVIIIEGVSGSGKDAFQTYLKEKLKGRDIYDFSEGELLHSWKHFPIPGILRLRLNFLTQFVKYLKNIVERDSDAIFLLNRFHLSTYVTTVLREPEFRKEYEDLINVLRTLPVHVFILQMDENEIEERTLHSERSTVWRKVQQQIIAKDGFDTRLKKYSTQQQLMIQAAEAHRIPYSIVKFSNVAVYSRRRDLKVLAEKSRPVAHISRKI